ncbi:MAG: hypothetical protein CMF50_08100 [Legionellales bacterium]|nr:hypothetical protein [Legionellales bacterium]|tara:strand:+ start:23337 stop:25172 length:1836 start_codon:yes stop_codon:yes gene_type:complete
MKSMCYWQYYGMLYDPFSRNPDGKEVYVPRTWEKQLDLLLHLSHTSHAILTIVGVSGIGKTSLMQEFICRVGDNTGICKIEANASIKAIVVKQLLARHLGLKTEDAESPNFESLLIEQLAKMQENRQHYLLVVDDAHRLPREALEALLALAPRLADANCPLHILLFGCTQLEANIADITTLHMGEELTHTVHMQPFNRDTSELYVLHGLKAAGMRGVSPFSQEDIDLLYRRSAGIPGKINIMAQQVLQKKLPEQDIVSEKPLPTGKRRDLRITGAATAGVFAALVVIAFVWDKNRMHHHASVPTQQTVAQAPSTQLNNERPLAANATVNMTPVSDDEIAAELSSRSSDAVGSKRFPEESAMPQNQAAQTTTAKAPQSTATTDNTFTVADNSPAQSPTQATTEANPVESTAAVEPSFSAAAEAPPANPSVAAQELAKPATNVAAKKQPALAATATTEVKPKTAADVKPKAKSEDPILVKDATITPTQPMAFKSTPTPAQMALAERSKTAVKPIMPDEGRLLSAQPTEYTLQVMGARDVLKLEQEMEAFKVNEPVMYFHTLSQGRDWYVAVIGIYPSAESAKAAIEDLPASLQKKPLWVRSMGSVQQSIQSAS